jgi:hypothetical protein
MIGAGAIHVVLLSKWIFLLYCGKRSTIENFCDVTLKDAITKKKVSMLIVLFKNLLSAEGQIYWFYLINQQRRYMRIIIAICN